MLLFWLKAHALRRRSHPPSLGGRALDAVGWEVVEVLPPEMEQCYEVWGHVLATDIPRTLDDYTGTISDEGAHGVGAGQARSAPRGGEAEKEKNEEESEEEEECVLARATHIAD